MTAAALNLTARDFDAYAREKATSNAYSRPRLELKQRALAWGRGVVERVAELGVALDVQGSDEFPSLRNKKRVDCQWVYLSRDEADKAELDGLLDAGRSLSDAIDEPSPHTRHAMLALKLDARSVEVSFSLHPDATVDVENLRGRLDTPTDGPLVRELVAALEHLPEQFELCVGSLGEASSSDRVPCASAAADVLRATLARASETRTPLFIGWHISRETALAHTEILDEQLEDALVALAPIYGFVAWSRENDHASLGLRLEGVRRERELAHASVREKNDRWLAERALERARSVARARARVGEERGAAKPVLTKLFDGGQRSEGAEATKKRSGPAPRSSAVPLEKGARVRVRSGPFVDKVGTVSEVDGRGGARVMLGLLSSRFELGDLDLVVEGRDRPALQSSHKRPGQAPRKAR